MGHQYESSRGEPRGDDSRGRHSGGTPGRSTLVQQLPTDDAIAEAGMSNAQAPDATGRSAGVPAAPPIDLQRCFGRPDAAGTGAGSGSALPGAIQRKMQDGLGADFSSVRVELEGLASSSGAVAAAQGETVRFAPGHYQPDSPAGQHLIAHELTHVVQQRRGGAPATQYAGLGTTDSLEAEAERAASTVVAGGRAAVSGASSPGAPQRSTLSDQVTAAWTARHDRDEIFGLLRTAAGASAADADLTRALETIFSGRFDDLWLARTLQQHGPEASWPAEAGSQTRETASGAGRSASATVYRFAGQEAQVALVVAGVHGSEQSGVEVAERLVRDLQTGVRPYYTVYIVPRLFEASYAAAAPSATRDDRSGRMIRVPRGGRGRSESVDPNRNLLAPGTNVGDRMAADGTTPLDSEGRPVAPENVLLLQLIDRIQPSRVCSVHAHSYPFNGRTMAPTQDGPGIFADPRTTASTATAADQAAAAAATEQDDYLALAMAERAHRGGAHVPQNFLGDSAHVTSRYPTQTGRRSAGRSGQGTSLGQWGPRATATRPAMTVITVEVEHYHRSDTRGAAATRAAEIQAETDAIREVFLGPPTAVADEFARSPAATQDRTDFEARERAGTPANAP